MEAENKAPAVSEDADLQSKIAMVRNLLANAPFVEGAALGHNLARKDLLEALARRQNRARLARMLRQYSPRIVARILDAIPADEAFEAWNEVSDHQREDVLRYVHKALRTELIGFDSAKPNEPRLSIFELHEGVLRRNVVQGATELAQYRPIWIDLLNPTDEIRGQVNQLYGVDLPDPADLTDIETSARFFVEDSGEMHLHSDFLFDDEEKTHSISVALVVHKNILFTVRDVELPIFRLQRLRASSQPGLVTDCKDILLGLFGLEMEYSADTLEDAYTDLETLTQRVLTRQHLSDREARKILLEIPHCEDVNARIRRNVLDTQRALSFLERSKTLSPDQRDDCEKILRDIESIENHTAFIFGKINFLMDTTSGFVNVNQNERMNRLTYASLALMVVSLVFGLGG